MLASAIRELSASQNPLRIAAALFESIVQVWDVASQTKISEFPTVFCFGAKNLALSPATDVLVAGQSKKGGIVAAYEIPSGKKIWERRLVYPSSLRFHASCESILCTNNRESVVRLDAHTGLVLEEIAGTSDLIEGPLGYALTVPAPKGAQHFCLITKDHSFDITRCGFALLDAVFSDKSICLTEAGGPVRCISFIDGELKWIYHPGSESHVLNVHYRLTLDAYFGILWNFEKGGHRTLVKFDAATGEPEEVCKFDSWAEVFLEKGDQLVTSSGAVRELSSGTIVNTFDFPQKEYPSHN